MGRKKMIKKTLCIATFIWLLIVMSSYAHALTIMIDPDGLKNALLLNDDDFFASLQNGPRDQEVQKKLSALSERISKEGPLLVNDIKDCITSKGFNVVELKSEGYGIGSLTDRYNQAIPTGLGKGEISRISYVDPKSTDLFLHIAFSRSHKKWEILLMNLRAKKYFYEEIDTDKKNSKELNKILLDAVQASLGYVPKLLEETNNKIVDTKI